MYAVIRKFNQMRDVREAGRRAEAGLAPLLREMPGFRGYYVVAGDGTVGASITLYENQEAAQQAHQRAMGWIRENLADLTEAEPEVTAGEVLVSVEARPEMVA
jgi:heme-degrading monooxygenase HmoA